jgi:hypothetical protein
MKYVPFFHVEILHSYYADQRCRDFFIQPTPETQKTLQNIRGQLKPFSNGIQILVPVMDDGHLFIPITVDSVLVFQLRLQNQQFPLFTDLTEMSQIAFPVYTNTNAEPQLKLTSRRIVATEQFTVLQPLQTERFVLRGKPQSGLQPNAFLLEGLGAVSKPSAYEEATKIITVNSASASIGTPFRVMYPMSPPPTGDVFAEVEIKCNKDLLDEPSGQIKFHILFKAKPARWKYYVVLNKVDNNPPIPTIEDKENLIVFKEADRTDLVRMPDPADGIAVRLAQQYPNLQYFRFVSNSLVPCSETARKTIQLQLDGDKVVEALPNPLIQNYVLDVRNASKEHALYHVVNYFTHPLS